MASDNTARCNQVLTAIRGEVNKMLVGQEERI